MSKPGNRCRWSRAKLAASAMRVFAIWVEFPDVVGLSACKVAMRANSIGPPCSAAKVSSSAAVTTVGRCWSGLIMTSPSKLTEHKNEDRSSANEKTARRRSVFAI